jgi:hypothetical protein
MSEEAGFEVVDKRRVRADASETADSARPEPEASEEASEPEAAAAGPEADEPETEELDDDLDDVLETPDLGAHGFNPFAGITVDAILQMSLGLLAERAWVTMGLVDDPSTGKIEKNFEECRRAIDVVADLAKHLEPVASPEDRRELQRMVTDLRLNFVRQRDG